MIGNGDMAADVYDANADGKVNSADEADRIYAPNGAKNKILGISEDGTQE